MYSSDSQHYVYIPDSAYDNLPLYHSQQTRRNEVLDPMSASQYNYGQSHSMDHGSSYANDSGYLQMPHSNGGYETMSTAPYCDTAESIQRDFDRYMRETGSMAPLPPATHHSAQAIHPYNQQPPVMANPYPTYGDAHAPAWDYHGGQEATLPASGRGKGSSTSTRPRPQPYAKAGPAALPKESRTVRKDEVVTDARIYPSTTKLTNPLGPLGPSNHVVVPQIVFSWGSTTYNNISIPPITFMPKGRHELGINIAQRLSERHAIENSDDKVLSLAQGIREIKIKFQWPGYFHFPFETRIRTHDGNITRGELLDRLCSAVVEFVLMLKKERSANVSKEYARWKIGGKGLKADTFFITGLLHRGGNYFQPEIWVPRQSKE